MSERIRYAWGQSSLGDFIVATSDDGLVGLEFAQRDAAALAALRARFPEAALDADESGLADLVEKLVAAIEHPYLDPGIALDLRGSEYQKKVWNILRRIPAGQTTTYGAIAAEMGTPRDARDVTDAVASNAIAILIPCHRVVKKDGSLSGYRWGARRKRMLLTREQHSAAFRLMSRSAGCGVPFIGAEARTAMCEPLLKSNTVT
jgi:AraC family transcriptional regulator of adaptative response/methylated-DNA-[protein]-cysteine methyltransferase